MRVAITDTSFSDADIERAELGPSFDLMVGHARTEDEVVNIARGASGLLVQWAPITDRVLARLPDVQVVVRYGVGLDNVDTAAAAARGVLVANVPDYCVDEVADHAIALILATARRLPDYAEVTHTGGWESGDIPAPRPASEDPVGIAGYGRIGRALGERARALGFPVIVYDPYLSTDEFEAGIERADTLHALAGSAKHLSLHLPASNETTGVCDAQVLEALGSAGHLVNTARGALVDEPALLAALETGSLWRASLDVLGTEPPVGVSAQLAQHPQVTCTPHVAYLSTTSSGRLRERAAAAVRDHLLQSAASGASQHPAKYPHKSTKESA